MADPDATLEAVKHVGGAAGGGGLMAVIMQFLRSKDARDARDALIALQGKVDRLVADVEKLGTVAKEVTTNANAVAALHRRTDGQDDRLDDHEERLRSLEAGGAAPATTPPQRPRRR